MAKYFHADVDNVPVTDSDRRGEQLAEEHGKQITDLGGHLDVGRNFGERPAVMIVTLPDDSTVNPGDLIGGLTFNEVTVTHYPVQPDHGITGDEA